MTDYEKIKSCCWVAGTAGVLLVCYKLCGAIESAENLMGDTRETMMNARKTMDYAEKTMIDAKVSLNKVDDAVDSIRKRGIGRCFLPRW